MVRVDVHKPIARITLDRPDLHNALNAEMIRDVTRVFTTLSVRDDVRVIVLAGNGKSFCAGADLNYMKRLKECSREEHLEDGRRLAHMYLTIASCPKPVIARVHGAALGGGAGLVAACDVGIAVASARFGFPEVKLGLLPAVISPFVISRIGPGRAREYFITGERFSAAAATKIGLIEHVVANEPALDVLIDSKISQILTSAPGAVAAAKELIFGVTGKTFEASLDLAAGAIARARVGAEGQAGMQAFLENQKPPWIETDFEVIHK